MLLVAIYSAALEPPPPARSASVISPTLSQRMSMSKVHFLITVRVLTKNGSDDDRSRVQIRIGNWEIATCHSPEPTDSGFWQRLLITLVAMLAVSFIIGFVSRSMFGFGLPDYGSGVVGGLTALPLWSF